MLDGVPNETCQGKLPIQVKNMPTIKNSHKFCQITCQTILTSRRWCPRARVCQSIGLNVRQNISEYRSFAARYVRYASTYVRMCVNFIQFHIQTYFWISVYKQFRHLSATFFGKNMSNVEKDQCSSHQVRHFQLFLWLSWLLLLLVVVVVGRRRTLWTRQTRRGRRPSSRLRRRRRRHRRRRRQSSLLWLPLSWPFLSATVVATVLQSAQLFCSNLYAKNWPHVSVSHTHSGRSFVKFLCNAAEKNLPHE